MFVCCSPDIFRKLMVQFRREDLPHEQFVFFYIDVFGDSLNSKHGQPWARGDEDDALAKEAFQVQLLHWSHFSNRGQDLPGKSSRPPSRSAFHISLLSFDNEKENCLVFRSIENQITPFSFFNSGFWKRKLNDWMKRPETKLNLLQLQCDAVFLLSNLSWHDRRPLNVPAFLSLLK